MSVVNVILIHCFVRVSGVLSSYTLVLYDSRRYIFYCLLSLLDIDDLDFYSFVDLTIMTIISWEFDSYLTVTS